ncbi:hypothetical protein RB594_009296 [Gaeumannomyces avenae]
MASPSILIIGATGHIGSSVLAGLKELNLDARMAALARTEKDFQAISDIYPGVRCVLGSTEDLPMLEQESLKAEIVINTSPDIPYEAGIRVILTALARPRRHPERPSTSTHPARPTYGLSPPGSPRTASGTTSRTSRSCRPCLTLPRTRPQTGWSRSSR